MNSILRRPRKKIISDLKISANSKANGIRKRHSHASNGTDKSNSTKGAKEVYCKCRNFYDSKQKMVKCDGSCGDWYHQKCMNLSD